MKSIIIFLMYFISCINIYGQNWSCFPENQYSYYQFNGFNGPAIDLIIQDSIISNGIQNKLFFRRLIQNPGAPECRNSVYSFYESNEQYTNPNFLDSLETNGDSVFYTQSPYLIYFLPSATVGQSWTMNTFGTINITCDSVYSDTSFGVADSIKIFYTSGAIPGQQIRLSKRFGFLDFISFNNFANNTGLVFYQLVGLNDTSGQYGFQPPLFLDYLPYQAGDILKWDFHHDGSPTWSPTFHYTFRDSITQVSAYPDSLVYSYDRIEVDSGNNISIIPGLTRRFSRTGFGNLLESPSKDIGISDRNQFGSDYAIYYTSFYNLSNDTVQLNNWIERNFRWTNSNLDSDCTIIPIIDGVSDQYSFNTHQGLVYEKYYGQGFNLFYTLIGASIGGVIYGNPELNPGIEEIDNISLEIFPNPAHDKLFIYTGNWTYNKIFIFDLFGRINFTQSKLTDPMEIDISILSSGTYFIKIQSDKKFIARKFYKK